ncbi:hypothetical protein NADE_002560 [Nannochloris sp. 'desiccata']|nr:hypothetical protein KSW81_005721 [Chlorella desiccata (nom. nud.)]KAH7623370.1 hypothetical protein NADE_002560 [Chlorella desiccata (nom. nud.)]
MLHSHKVLLLVSALILLSNCNCEEEADELYRVKTTLRDCRSDLNNLEVAKDRCSESQIELKKKIKELQNKISDLIEREHLLLGAKEETDLVRKELLIAHDRLAVCDTTSKSHESREAICRQDLDLARAELNAAAAREAEAEKALRQNDCTAARRDLRTYRDMAEQSAIDAAALKKKITELESVANSVSEIESKLTAAKRETSNTEAEVKKVEAAKQTVQAEMEAKTGALQAELDATKKALESLLASLDTRQKYEALLENHEKEWLPHWLEERMHAVIAIVHAAAASAVRLITHIINKLQSIVSTIWELYIVPVLANIDSVLVSLPGWVEIRNALLQSMRSIESIASHIGKGLFHHILLAEEASEGFVLHQLQRVDSLKSVARHEVVHYAFWGAFASLVLPMSLAILKFLAGNLLYILRPGSALIRDTATEHQAAEELLGYKFSKADTLKRVFASAEAGNQEIQTEIGAGTGRKRLALLGTAVAQTLAAEKALTLSSSPTAGPQEESTLYTIMQQATAMGTTTESLAATAAEIGIAQFVQAGPGARSHAVAQATQAELYSACLGAVYLDSEFDVHAAREVWNRKNKKGRGEGGAAAEESSFSAMATVSSLKEQGADTATENDGDGGASGVDDGDDEES